MLELITISAYINEQERPDIVGHRTRFVDEMTEWKRRIETYVGDDMEICIEPELPSGERKVVLVTQADCKKKKKKISLPMLRITPPFERNC